MSRTILLDSGPLGLITNPKASPVATLNRPDVVVATTNARHLSLYVPAQLWTDIA